MRRRRCQEALFLSDSDGVRIGCLRPRRLRKHCATFLDAGKDRSVSTTIWRRQAVQRAVTTGRKRRRYEGQEQRQKSRPREIRPGRKVRARCPSCLRVNRRYSGSGRTVTATACADSPAQALPRDVVRGQNPNDRSPSDRTDCAALPSSGAPAQPAAPPKPKPDADGFIWHPRPGYPDQEISEPDAQGRVAYKIHMTTAACAASVARDGCPARRKVNLPFRD